MIKKILILVALFALAVVVSCSTLKKSEETPAAPIYPTATSHFLFIDGSTAGVLPTVPGYPTGTPTVASVFYIYPSATPYPYETPTPRNTPFDMETPTAETATSATAAPTQHLFEVEVYKDDLNPNWDIQKSSGMEIYLDNTDPVYRGQSAVSFTPLQNGGILYFTVKNPSTEVFQRDSVSRLLFWLYSGEDTLSLDQFSVSVVSSNTPTFWSADEQPVGAVDNQPVLFESREVAPDLNGPIPPHTWAPVEIDLTKNITHDPDFRYFTGFYIKISPNVSRPLAIDDIRLEMIGDAAEIVSAVPTPQPGSEKVVHINVDPTQDNHPISKLIYGLSGAPADVLKDLKPPLNNWGGSASTRYNWEIGHAWNTGLDGFYRNENFGITSGSASDDFISRTLDAGADVRLTLPALGWVAKDGSPNTCSFPLPDGTCGNDGGASCLEPGKKKPDPYLANVPSYLKSAMSWVQYLLQEKSYNIRFLAIDNEPELWGITHYDVHPDCTTYDEILSKYLLYTNYLHSYAPQAELVGPSTSGWYYFWNSAAGKEDKRLHSNVDFIPWFLRQLRRHDQETGRRSLHVLDIHYFPENVYNDQVDEITAALRLRSTRSLWDKKYVDESAIDEAIYLIPRMKALIEENYPGTKLGISAWNWGAEKNINGALAIADVLGIFGREDLYYATYWQYPPINSPGYFAFKLYTNYDGHGAHFGDTSILAESQDVDVITSYAALDSATGNLHILLVNKKADGTTLAQIGTGSFIAANTAEMYRYDSEHPEGIKAGSMIITDGNIALRLPASSMTLLVLHPQSK